jgi:hypothetical protein
MASRQRAYPGTNREYKLFSRQRHYYVTNIHSISFEMRNHINTLTNKYTRQYKTYYYINHIIFLAFGSFNIIKENQNIIWS